MAGGAGYAHLLVGVLVPSSLYMILYFSYSVYALYHVSSTCRASSWHERWCGMSSMPLGSTHHTRVQQLIDSKACMMCVGSQHFHPDCDTAGQTPASAHIWCFFDSLFNTVQWTYMYIYASRVQNDVEQAQCRLIHCINIQTSSTHELLNVLLLETTVTVASTPLACARSCKHHQ